MATASNTLRAFLSQYINKDKIGPLLAELESKGSISDEAFAAAGIKKPSTLRFMKAQVNELSPIQDLSKLTQRQQKQFLNYDDSYNPDNIIDEANLTDDELQTRKGVFQQLGKTGGVLDRGTLERHFESKIRAYGIATDEPQVKNIASHFAGLALEKGRYPTSDEFRERFPNSPPPVQNFFNDQNAANEGSGLIKGLMDAPNTFEDVGRIEDILKTRGEEKQQEEKIENFVTKELPQELSAASDSRANVLRELGQKRFEEMAPQVLARENAVRGLDTGAVGDALGSTYGDIQGNVEAEIARMGADNDSFIFNAAYQNMTRKILMGQADVGAGIAMERQNIRQGQEQRFQQGQFDLNKNLENDLLMQRYETQIRSAQLARQRQQEMMSQQKRAGLFGGIGQASSALGMGLGALLAPGTGGASLAIGAGVGGAVGSGVGIGLPYLFGKR